jgi:hypothetical protein
VHAPEPPVGQLLEELRAALIPTPLCDLCGQRHEGDCLEHALKGV